MHISKIMRNATANVLYLSLRWEYIEVQPRPQGLPVLNGRRHIGKQEDPGDEVGLKNTKLDLI